uniref:Uncharacterized protein n=1 Tax=Salmo trutta TaxID=8032 RepID=A0A674C1K6_SALTR
TGQILEENLVQSAFWKMNSPFKQEACLASAFIACQLVGTTSPSQTQCRTPHSTSQLFNVKETPQAATEEEVGAFTKLIEKIKIAALHMYTCCVERMNYDEFFEKCSLPDTLNSWFLVAQLHVYSVRYRHASHMATSLKKMYLLFHIKFFGRDREVRWRPLLEENAQSILKVPSSTYNDAGL